MNIFGLHFHAWKELWDIRYDKTVAGGRYAKAHYRVCACGKWQEYRCNYGDCWWVDCDRPANAEQLVVWQ